MLIKVKISQFFLFLYDVYTVQWKGLGNIVTLYIYNVAICD